MIRATASQSIASLFERPDHPDGHVVEFDVHPNSPMRIPTAEAYGQLQYLVAEINRRHFGDTLPNVMLTFTRHPFALGYFCAEAFRDRSGAVAHEIALNPTWFDPNDDVAVFRTIGHEMAHLWRHLFGGRNRKGGYGAPGYHDKKWAEKMVEIGLMPSSTGLPGGKQTGFHMSDYLIEGGPFDLTCRELIISGFKLDWRDGSAEQPSGPGTPHEDENGAGVRRPRRGPTRTRFVCAGCNLIALTRRNARLTCTDCDLPLAAR